MKKLLIILTALFIVLLIKAESPQKISYQAIIRNAKGELVKNQAIGMKISIYFYNKTTPVTSYAETQTPTTNENGLVSIEIGTGKVVTGVFADINWAVRAFYLKTEIDPGGRTSYSITSETQILSVPYALHAKTAENFTETDPTWKGAADTLAAIGRKGNVGIGITAPTALLHTQGIGTGEGNVLFTGSYKSTKPGDPPASGEGTRMMWYPDKAAFRAGEAEGKNWDKDSIGDHSMAMGYNTKASGRYSTAMGDYTTASGYNSTAMGYNTKASGLYSTALGGGSTASKDYSTAMGYETIASGNYSTAMGHWTSASGQLSTALGYLTTASGTCSIAFGSTTTASGRLSTAMGNNTTAPSGYETVIGSYNTEYTPKSTNSWDSNDRLFVVGNGTEDTKRSNALTILKNGDMTVGGNLRVEGSITGNKLEQQVGVVVNTTLSAGATTNISFTFPNAFSGVPMAYVGNITSGGGFAEVVMSLANITTTGGKLFIYNPKTSSQSPNYTVKIIALGAE